MRQWLARMVFVALAPWIGIVGWATWYGADFHNLPTASGGVYNMYALSTACHPSLLGRRMEVTILDGSDRSVAVRCEDTGPWRWAAEEWEHLGINRIDLSMAAFAKLAPLGTGVIPIKIEVQDGREAKVAD